MAGHRYPIIDRLIRQANQTASRQPDPVQLLAHMVRLALDDGADPYLLAGVLIEGAAYTVARHVPPDRQTETVDTIVGLLSERLKAHGL